MKIQLESGVEDVRNLVGEKLGRGKVFLVGGFVRDQLRHRVSKDIDIATSADPESTKQAFPYGYASHFGTVSFKLNGYSITIATRRKEDGYQDFRHPKHITYVTTREEDCLRRDFTINALYADYEGNLFDPTGHGRKDIKKKRLSRIGKPRKRLEEDPLRILRAFRFSKELNLKITHRLYRSRIKSKDLILNLKKGKIREEVNKCPEKFRQERVETLSLRFAFEEEQ